MTFLQIRTCLLVGLVVVTWSLPKTDLWAQAGKNADVHPGRLYVKLNRTDIAMAGGKTGLAIFDKVASIYGMQSVEKAFPFLDIIAQHRTLEESTEALRQVYVVSFSDSYAPTAVARALGKDPAVLYAEPIPVHRAIGYTSGSESHPIEPNDVRYSNQVHLERMRLPAAWDVAKGESGNVVIGIVDSGNEWRHPDLMANVWTNPGEIAGNGVDDDGNGFVDDVHGWSFAENSPDPFGSGNYSFHGTAVSGAAAAVTDNERGIAGSSWNAKYIPINANCVDRNLLCSTASGVMYAAVTGADIINASYGSSSSSETTRLVYQAAEEEGALVVASSGNDGNNVDLTPHYPSGFRTTLSVGGTRKTSNRNVYNYGRSVSVFAPGVGIDVTRPGGGYGSANGTSFATPLTAGVAALVKTAFPQFTPQQVREQVRLTADNIDADNMGLEGRLGRGFVNAERAVTESPSPGVRLVEFKYENQDGNQEIKTGDVVKIEAMFTNYHGDASSLTIGFASEESYLTFTTPDVAVGAMPSGATRTVNLGFTVGSNAPDNQSALLFTRISEGPFVDTPDVVLLPINQTAAALHQTSAMKVSITNEGNIGYTAFQGEAGSQGQGFRVLDRNGEERDPLFEGGLLIATGFNRVSDCIRGETSGGGQDSDLALKGGTLLEILEPGSLTSQEGRVVLTDSTARNPIGVEILQESYVEDTQADEDFVILKYTVTNTGPNSLQDLHVGLFFDWDVDLGGADNDRTGFNTDLGVGYVTDSNGSLAVGVRLLSTTGDLSYRTVHNPDEIYDGFTEAEKWRFLSGGINNVNRPATDVSQIIGSGPHALEPAESVEVAFAVIGGRGGDDLIVNAQRAKVLWDDVINRPRELLTLPGMVADQTYIQGRPIADLVLPEAMGGTPPYTYTLMPELPGQLSFDATTRTVSGTPSSVLAPSLYTYSAADAGSESVELQFSITVVEALSLPGTVSNQTYTQSEAISDLVFPEATGGAPPYAYSLSPEPPPGLTFDAPTRSLSGTPSSVMPSTQYTYAATDAAGEIAEIQFSLEVIAAPLSRQDSRGIPDDIELLGNYPNPFSRSINVLFGLPEPAEVSVTIIDMLGREMQRTGPMRFAAGREHAVTIHGDALPAGTYLYRLLVRTADEEIIRTGTMLRVK